MEVSLETVRTVFLAARVLGLEFGQAEERSLVALTGNPRTLFCTLCMAMRDVASGPDGNMVRLRPVVSSLEVQLMAAEARLTGSRPCTRVALGSTISALLLPPALGAMHGLGTSRESLYGVVFFDTLYVWKLGALCLLAQRLQALMEAVYPDGEAILGTVQVAVDVVDWRGFELGRLCRASPSTPGYAWSSFSGGDGTEGGPYLECLVLVASDHTSDLASHIYCRFLSDRPYPYHVPYGHTLSSFFPS